MKTSALVLSTLLAAGIANAGDPAQLLNEGAEAAAVKGVASDLASSFNGMDQNHDGLLSTAEVEGQIKLSEQFAEVDADGDGQLSLTEYSQFMEQEADS